MDNLNELNKMTAAVKAANLKHEEIKDGIVVILNGCVLVTAYWDWSNLLTHIYMSKDVYLQMLFDMITHDTDLSIPVFAYTYGYGYVAPSSASTTCDVAPFDTKCISEERIANFVLHNDAVTRAGHPNDPDVLYQIVAGDKEDPEDFAVAGVFNNFFKVREDLRKYFATHPNMMLWSAQSRYRLNMIRTNVLYGFED